jgi:hypothetical protein
MKAIFGIEKDLKQYYGSPPIGNYALESPDPAKNVHWDHCREQFAAKFSETIPGFFFSHADNKGEDVANFITKFEKIVGLGTDAKPFSVFSKTNRDNILWIEVANFWRPCLMKRSLLSMLMRCGLNYISAEDNFDDALFGDFKESIYVRETKSAILRFMFGFTKFTGQRPVDAFQTSMIKHGWREEFLKIDDLTVRRRLVLPDDVPKEVTIVGLESLWN